MCGNLEVPLDYTEPSSNATLTLQLARVPASSQPSKGSILFNFGGPGATGRGTLGLLGPALLALTSGHYDLIAFDPRGTGNTLPFSCTDNDIEGDTMLSELILGNSSDVALGRLWTRGTINAELCFQKSKATGSLIGTAFVARDLISVVDALGEDGMLRYWGFSYGTTLGATVASMFPEKIDRMILDGVQNPHQYYNSPADFEEWSFSDNEFSGIFSSCVAAPDLCSLARENSTAAELEQSVWDLIDTVKYHPIALGSFMLDYNTLKAIIVLSMYTTFYWPALTTLLDMLLTGNTQGALAAALEILGGLGPTEEARQMFMSVMGIHCADRTVRLSSFDDFLPVVNKLYNTSKIFGDVTPEITAICAQWKMKAQEIYDGDFKAKTKKPVLFIGNTGDGFTPLTSAYNVSSGFKDSVVLEVNGYGHSSLAVPSTCVLNVVTAYWLNGTLPELGTICQADTPPFSNTTLTKRNAWGDISRHLGKIFQPI